MMLINLRLRRLNETETVVELRLIVWESFARNLHIVVSLTQGRRCLLLNTLRRKYKSRLDSGLLQGVRGRAIADVHISRSHFQRSLFLLCRGGTALFASGARIFRRQFFLSQLGTCRPPHSLLNRSAVTVPVQKKLTIILLHCREHKI